MLQRASVFAQADGQWWQARVEQRVMIRLPQSSSAPRGIPTGKVPKRIKMKEKKIGKCLWMKQLVVARPGADKPQHLEFVTKNGQIIRGYLGDGCLAREFYAGTYMERTSDGKLCAERDILYARTGAKCEVDKFRVMVPK